MQKNRILVCRLENKNLEKSIDELMQEIDKRDAIFHKSLKNLDSTRLRSASRDDLLLLCIELISINRLRELLISDLCAYMIEMA